MGALMPRPYARLDESMEVTQVAEGGGQATSQRRIWHDAHPMGGTATTGGVTVRWAAATDVGNQRKVNEDAVLALPPVFVVADGMGGHQAGDVASGLVVDRFGSIVEGVLSDVGVVVDILEDVNESILAEGRRTGARSGMGTTAVGLLLVDNGERASWLLFNIGDSRAYRLLDGRLEQLSVDHSYVQELIDAGQITARSARTHPHRNVVTRALGVEEGSQPDIWLRPPQVGERFLLCSDGLSSEVDDAGIRRDLAPGSVQDAAQRLVQSALAAGGHDNVTVLVVEVLDLYEASAIEVTSPRDGITARVEPEIDMVPSRTERRGSESLIDNDLIDIEPVDTEPIDTELVDAELIDRVPPQAELADAGAVQPGVLANVPDPDDDDGADDDDDRVPSGQASPLVDGIKTNDGEGPRT